MASPEARRRANRNYYNRNAEKYAKWEVEYRKRPEVVDRLKFWYLLRNYNLTRQAHEEIIARQHGKCPVCNQPLPENPKLRHVDHDHKCCDRFGSCGKCIRGILCQNCNHGLGSFMDSVDFLEGAARYLKSFAGTNFSGDPGAKEEDTIEYRLS
jgi:hypothetical protein